MNKNVLVAGQDCILKNRDKLETYPTFLVELFGRLNFFRKGRIGLLWRLGGTKSIAGWGENGRFRSQQQQTAAGIDHERQ